MCFSYISPLDCGPGTAFCITPICLTLYYARIYRFSVFHVVHEYCIPSHPVSLQNKFVNSNRTSVNFYTYKITVYKPLCFPAGDASRLKQMARSDRFLLEIFNLWRIVARPWSRLRTFTTRRVIIPERNSQAGRRRG